MRALPSRAGIYFVLAMTLFPGIGYLRVWGEMTAALEDLGLPRPSEKALRDLRRRLGPAPVKAMFETVAVPLASPGPRASPTGPRTVSFDGLNSVKVPDSGRNRSWLGKTMTCLGWPVPGACGSWPWQTGTRGLLGAVIGGKGGEARCRWPASCPLAPPGDAAAGRPGLRRGGAAEEGRRDRGARPGPRQRRREPPVLEVLPDGSYLSRIDGLGVRIIEAAWTCTVPTGPGSDGYRLITTLLDWRRDPAGEPVRLYHERWVRHEVAWSEWSSRKEVRLMSVM